MDVKGYIPQEIVKYTELFFTNDDLKLIEVLMDKSLTLDEISKKLGFDGSDIVKKAYQKELVIKVEDGKNIEYCLLPASSRVNNAAVFERDLWESIPEEDVKVLTKWHYSNFLSQKAATTLEEKLENLNCVLPLEQAIEYLKQHGESFTIIPCDCHSKNEYMGYDRNVCICLSDGINTHADRGLGERKSLEETIDLLNLTDKLGLIHSGEKHNICNCNVKYCYPMRASIDLGLEHQWPQTEYQVKFDAEKCVKCKACMKRCQFDVFELQEDHIVCDESKCWGCGLCVSKCPGNALSIEHI